MGRLDPQQLPGAFRTVARAGSMLPSPPLFRGAAPHPATEPAREAALVGQQERHDRAEAEGAGTLKQEGARVSGHARLP